MTLYRRSLLGAAALLGLAGCALVGAAVGVVATVLNELDNAAGEE